MVWSQQLVFLLFLSQMMKRKIAQKLESDDSKDYDGDCWALQ